MPTWAQEITVGFAQDRSPFVIGQTDQGLEIEIFRAALADKGHTVKVVNIPKKRLWRLSDSIAALDAVATVMPVANDGLYYVNGFIYFDAYAFTKVSDNLTINKISDLKGLETIAWENAYKSMGAGFEKLFQPEPKEDYKKHYSEKNQKIQNLMFWENRVQVIIVDRIIFAWHRKQLQNKIDTSAEIKMHPIFPRKTYAAAFKDKKIADNFAVGLAKIKKSGLYAQLYRNYTE
ncbi:MAG: transporter substrate-binding domain-containing protein [Methylococcales bacterium]|nr:transporter substrate-binding domain-containing protein [Methylococcales bacterium]